MRDYDATVKNLREAAKGLLFDAMPYRASVMKDAADAIEELLAELERYRHAAFVIGETCVEESKCHITATKAVKKIRENIYCSRQMPLPEPPKGVE